MACILDGNTLTLTGDVGDMWMSDCFTHGDVVLALAQIDEDAALTVYLNSGGGLTDEGSAIHALLSRRVGTTDIVVDGVAASAASLIAMAGDTVTMSAGSVMMIHDPSGMTFGTSADHAKTAEMLEAIATAYARVYAAKSGKTANECRAIMRAEKWFAPEEAVTEGFADATSKAASKPAAAFDYRAYAHAPQRLKALAANRGWKRPAKPKNNRPERGGEEAIRSAAVAEYRERRTAVLAMEEAIGCEELAEHLIDLDMDQEAIRKALAAAPRADTSESYDRLRGMDRPRALNGIGLNKPMPRRHGAATGRDIAASAVAEVNKRLKRS